MASGQYVILPTTPTRKLKCVASTNWNTPWSRAREPEAPAKRPRPPVMAPASEVRVTVPFASGGLEAKVKVPVRRSPLAARQTNSPWVPPVPSAFRQAVWETMVKRPRWLAVPPPVAEAGTVPAGQSAGPVPIVTDPLTSALNGSAFVAASAPALGASELGATGASGEQAARSAA